jgi:NAD(P)-dependent dehydrogenase (short-subunit alcohol dehydrogenase family)
MKDDKVVFITGGDKGIGRAMVLRLAKLYRNIIFTYRTNVEGAQSVLSTYNNISCFQCDLSDVQQIKAVSDNVLEKFGKVDVLINNAGSENDMTFMKMDEQQWTDIINVNLVSLYYFAHSFIPGMINNNWGRIVNFTSIAGYTGAFGKSNYSAAKAGIVGFTKSLALEFGNKNITVNAISPGAIFTDMLMRIPEKYRGKILENIPMQRFGEVGEVADLAEFLISNKASYINGQTIHINGGSYMI